MPLFVGGARTDFLSVIGVSHFAITPRVSSFVRKVWGRIFLRHRGLTLLLGIALVVLVEIIPIFLVFIRIVASIIIIARIIVAAGLLLETSLWMWSNFPFLNNAAGLLHFERPALLMIALSALERAPIIVWLRFMIVESAALITLVSLTLVLGGVLILRTIIIVVSVNVVCIFEVASFFLPVRIPWSLALAFQIRFWLISVIVGALRWAIVRLFLKLARLIIPHTLSICTVALPIFC